MIIRGDIIELVKPMGDFSNIGEQCEVISVSEDAVISFRFGGRHLGCMSYNEFEKYFIKVEVKEKSKRKWTEWLSGTYELNIKGVGYLKFEAMKRNNGKRIQIRYKNNTGQSSCSPHDEFDMKIGEDVAIRRLLAKLVKKEAIIFINQ